MNIMLGFLKLGADRVVHPERDMGIRIAHNLVSKISWIILSFQMNFRWRRFVSQIRVSLIGPYLI